MNAKESSKLIRNRILMITIVVLVAIGFTVGDSFANSKREHVNGTVYTFSENSNYTIKKKTENEATNKTNTYGKFSVSGEISNISIDDGIPVYDVDGGNLKLFYDYNDEKLKANDKSWYVVSDKDKIVNGKKLEDKIKRGVILVQSSKDGENWIDEEIITNAFKETPIRTDAIYSTRDIQLLNGCYYKVTVAYESAKNLKKKKIFEDKEYKKTAEVYEFYARSTSAKDGNQSTERYELGEKRKCKVNDGYVDVTDITKKDSHYGWELGKFYVSGFTAKTSQNDKMIFLKNANDKVKLSFNLDQDINKLNGNKKLYISDDNEGYDQYFETPTMDFGKGTVIVRYTDHNNKVHEPQIYTNYLEANAKTDADTVVQLFEEGDYEVALDYEITNNKVVNDVDHYRIFFEFSVRNGNCMLYPMDLATGNELSNGVIAENGFKLDLAKSCYLKVSIKREVLSEGKDGLVEDTRFNRPAKDGEEYVEEGIYTITAENVYTKQTTGKTIYVGTDDVMKAHVVTSIPIDELNELIKDGATINDDGTINIENIENTPEEIITDEEEHGGSGIWRIVLVLIIVAAGVGAFYILKNKNIDFKNLGNKFEEMKAKATTENDAEADDEESEVECETIETDIDEEEEK